jgi:hypothetical protein
MSYFKFEDDDIIFNTLKTHPECHFYLYQTEAAETKLVYNNQKEIFGSFAATYSSDASTSLLAPNVRHIPGGFISLYELNIDRPLDRLDNTRANTIYPFITKDSSMTSFSTVSTSDFNNDFAYGDQITGSYPLSASISTQYVSSGEITGTIAPTGDNRLYRDALRTSFEYNVRTSKRFDYSKGLEDLFSSSPGWPDHAFRLIQIPSIFYGEKIKKGTVKLDWYKSGELVGTLEDSKQNGELLVTKGPTAEIGKFTGLIFYSEGFIILTNFSSIDGYADPTKTWRDFMFDLQDYHEDVETDSSDADQYPEAKGTDGTSSYSLYFKGTHTIPTLTLMATLEREECTHSNNPTFIDSDYDWQKLPGTIVNTTPGPAVGLATFQTSEPHKMGDLDTLIEGKIDGFVDPSGTPFNSRDLRFQVSSSNTFKVLKVKEDLSTAGIVLVAGAAAHEPAASNATSFYVKRTGYERQNVMTGSHGYMETETLKIKNTVKSTFNDPYAEYEDHTYISKIALYDEDRNLIGIAKLATPIKKTIKRDFTFKLKLDL